MLETQLPLLFCVRSLLNDNKNETIDIWYDSGWAANERRREGDRQMTNMFAFTQTHNIKVIRGFIRYKHTHELVNDDSTTQHICISYSLFTSISVLALAPHVCILYILQIDYTYGTMGAEKRKTIDTCSLRQCVLQWNRWRRKSNNQNNVTSTCEWNLRWYHKNSLPSSPRASYTYRYGFESRFNWRRFHF